MPFSLSLLPLAFALTLALLALLTLTLLALALLLPLLLTLRAPSPRTLFQATLHRLQASDQVPGVIQGFRLLVASLVAHGRGGFFQAVAQTLQIVRDLIFEGLRELRVARVNQAT